MLLLPRIPRPAMDTRRLVVLAAQEARMTDSNAPVTKHLATAREHAAGVKAHQAWMQELMAAHLLDNQAPIKNTPYPGPPPPATATS
jgi:hypothetical protein